MKTIATKWLQVSAAICDLYLLSAAIRDLYLLSAAIRDLCLLSPSLSLSLSLALSLYFEACACIERQKCENGPSCPTKRCWGGGPSFSKKKS